MARLAAANTGAACFRAGRPALLLAGTIFYSAHTALHAAALSNSEHILEEVIITGQRIEAALHAEQALTPGGVSGVDGEGLYKRSVVNIADMLRYVPGVWAESSSGSDELFMSSRGSNLDAGEIRNLLEEEHVATVSVRNYAEGQDGVVKTSHLNEEDGPVNQITMLAIDLAKTVFQLHGVDARGVAVLRRQVRLRQLCRCGDPLSRRAAVAFLGGRMSF